jgi:hypothetical protein
VLLLLKYGGASAFLVKCICTKYSTVTNLECLKELRDVVDLIPRTKNQGREGGREGMREGASEEGRDGRISEYEDERVHTML